MPTSTSHMERAIIEHTCWPRALLAYTVLALLVSPSATAGLQMYYYRNHTANSSRSEVWRVEALASILRVQSYVAYLLCNTSSNNGSGVSWKGQGTVNANFIQKPATNGKLLFVSNYTANTEEGIYTCVDSLSNDTLSINITNANPAIQAVSDVVNIEAGSSGQLKVYVSGIPNPSNDSITWFKLVPGEGPIEVNEPTVNFSSDRRTLLLTNVTTNEIYQCLVSLSAFPRTAKINIPVNAVLLAVFYQQPSPANLSLVQSANVTLSCSATGQPAPNIEWMRTDGRSLPPSSVAVVTFGNSTTTTSALSITHLQPQDSGGYLCQASVPGTSPVRSQPASIEVQPLPTEPATVATTTTIATMTTSAVTTLTSVSPLAGPSPIIIGASVGGLVLLVITGAVVLVVVTAYQRCTHRVKQVMSSTNSLADTDHSSSSMVRNPNYNVSWRKADRTAMEDAVVVGNSDVSVSPPKSASDAGSPNLCTDEENQVHAHIYSIATPPYQSDSTYSRLQWNSSVRKHPPPPHAYPSHSEGIPMRRMNSTAASVTSGPFDADDHLLSLNPSTISALSSVPSESPSLIPSSGLYKSSTLPTKEPAYYAGIGRGNASTAVGSSLQSVPENPSMPAYATPMARAVEKAPSSNLPPTPYLTPSVNSILTESRRVVVTPQAAGITYEEPASTSSSSQPWYEDDPDANDAPPTLSAPPHSSSSQSSRPPRQIQPYATVHNSAIPLTEASHARHHSRQLPRPPQQFPKAQETSFQSVATALV